MSVSADDPVVKQWFVCKSVPVRSQRKCLAEEKKVAAVNGNTERE